MKRQKRRGEGGRRGGQEDYYGNDIKTQSKKRYERKRKRKVIKVKREERGNEAKEEIAAESKGGKRWIEGDRRGDEGGRKVGKENEKTRKVWMKERDGKGERRGTE